MNNERKLLEKLIKSGRLGILFKTQNETWIVVAKENDAFGQVLTYKVLFLQMNRLYF